MVCIGSSHSNRSKYAETRTLIAVYTFYTFVRLQYIYIMYYISWRYHSSLSLQYWIVHAICIIINDGGIYSAILYRTPSGTVVHNRVCLTYNCRIWAFKVSLISWSKWLWRQKAEACNYYRDIVSDWSIHTSFGIFCFYLTITTAILLLLYYYTLEHLEVQVIV